MTITRTGKLARLPHTLREQLNQRLLDGESGPRLLAWLNALPEVQAILAAEFGGRPINQPNLTAWRQGGHRDWLLQRETKALAHELSHEALTWKQPDGEPVSEAVALWLTASYAMNLKRLDAQKGQAHWRMLREMTQDVGRLRRGEHSRERLALTADHLQFMREKTAFDQARKLSFPPPKLSPLKPDQAPTFFHLPPAIRQPAPHTVIPRGARPESGPVGDSQLSTLNSQLPPFSIPATSHPAT